MRSSFELFVALRYLRARRKQTFIGVITAISVLGVAAGVMALVVALAINNGFRQTLQRSLLGATAHVTILEKEPGYGIEDWRAVAEKVRRLPQAASVEPTLYGSIFLSGPVQASGAYLKGIDGASPSRLEALRPYMKKGAAESLADSSGVPPLLVGARLAEQTGIVLNARVTVISPQGEMTPFGPRPSYYQFRVSGIFESGFFELDSMWALTSLKAAQRVLSLGDVVNAIEIKIVDLDRAPEAARAAQAAAGPKLAATHWMEQNRQLLGALRMERAVTVVTIGLIQLVAALNILISLVMMVMEKNRDIAILMSLGARREQIRRIFQLQGLLIGVAGVVLGLAAGYTLSYLAGHYRWIRLDEAVYSLSFVPFEPRWLDGVWIAAGALVISFLATLYPASSATAIAPAEALRYE